MIEFCSIELLVLSRFLYQHEVTGDFIPESDEALNLLLEDELPRIVRAIKGIKGVCEKCGLSSSKAKCDRILRQIVKNEIVRVTELQVPLKELRERLEDELESEVFLHLSKRDAAKYSDPLAGWEECVCRFEKVKYNVEESSRCFALERYGASVFFVLLVAEYGVIQVAKVLNVEGDKPGWGSLNRLKDILSKPFDKRTELEQRHSKLLEDVVPLTTVFKDNWRHKMDHVNNQIVWIDTDFSLNMAEEIIVATRSFMRKLAAELPEKNS